MAEEIVGEQLRKLKTVYPKCRYMVYPEYMGNMYDLPEMYRKHLPFPGKSKLMLRKVIFVAEETA